MSTGDRHRRSTMVRCPRQNRTNVGRYPHLHLAVKAAAEQARHGRNATPQFCGCGGFHLRLQEQE